MKREETDMDNQNEFQKLLKRARWDRLFGALIVFVLLIILIVCIAKGCSKDKGENVTSTIAPVETQAVTEAQKDNSKAIFLSPSTQADNLYACDESVSERDAMFDIAGSVKTLLEADGYTVYMCGETDNVKNKVTRGNELRCGAYVALHSNSGDSTGAESGTECYYNSTITGSQSLAENIYNRVAELTPTEDKGVKNESQRELYEILNNQYPCCLLEIEYHDTTEHSQWILDNKDSIAKAVKDGIVAYLNGLTADETPSEDAAEESGESAE